VTGKRLKKGLGYCESLLHNTVTEFGSVIVRSGSIQIHPLPAIVTNNITCQVLIVQDALFASHCRITELCWLMLLVSQQQQPQMQDQTQTAESC